jgi:hypothetical protein
MQQDYGPSHRGILRSMIGGSMLFPGLMSQLQAEESAVNSDDPFAPRPTHFPARAKRKILLLRLPDHYFTASSSTTKCSVALGGTDGGEPFAP